MKVVETKRLILTKEEQKVIRDVYKILDDDKSLDTYGVWDILTDIFIGDESDDNMSADYGYKIEIVD